jgi:hypothetical protein
MYQYQSALVLGRLPYAQWQAIDAASLHLLDLFTQYRRCILTLTNTVFDGEVYIDLEPLRSEFSTYNGTLADWFISIGNRALPTIAKLPKSKVGYVQYKDAFQAGYRVDTTIIGRKDISISELESRDDLIVTRESTPTVYDQLYSKCLFTVNGYFHPTDYDDDGLYVKDGGRSFRRSRNNQLGIHSFANIGKVTTIPITMEQIHTSDPDTALVKKAYLTIPQATPNQSVLLSIGGYLVLPDPQVFWQISDHQYGLSLEHLPYLARYFESVVNLDLSSLPLSVSPIHPERVSATELFSDPVVTAYLTLSQSFWIVVDTPHLFFVRRGIETPALPGMFISHSRPIYPLIIGQGKIGEYWSTLEDGRWSLTVQNSFYRHHIFDTVRAGELTTVTSGLTPMQPFDHSRGWLLEIGAYQDLA